MKYLNDDHDKIDKNDNNGANTSEEIHSDEIPHKVVKRRSSRLKGAAASKVGAAKAVVKSVRMGCEISSQKPIEAEVKLLITGRQVEVTRLVTTSEDHCDDNNCTVCFESPGNSLGGSIDNIGDAIDNMEAKAKLDRADERRKRRRREYRLKRKLKRQENARREAERAANLQMTGLGSLHGRSIDMGG